jgi:hypothetical protein
MSWIQNVLCVESCPVWNGGNFRRWGLVGGSRWQGCLWRGLVPGSILTVSLLPGSHAVSSYAPPWLPLPHDALSSHTGSQQWSQLTEDWNLKPWVKINLFPLNYFSQGFVTAMTKSTHLCLVPKLLTSCGPGLYCLSFCPTHLDPKVKCPICGPVDDFTHHGLEWGFWGQLPGPNLA